MKPPLGPPPTLRQISLLARLLRLTDRPRHPPPADDATSGSAATAGGVPAWADPPAPEPTLYRQAREQIKRRAWGHAQRALERAAQLEPDCPAALDLTSVRTIRRALRRVARWPSDVEAHLELGRALFDLDLGDDALAEFLQVQRLAPDRYEGYALAALELLYRGEYARARSTWIKARERHPDLPELDDVLGSLPAK